MYNSMVLFKYFTDYHLLSYIAVGDQKFYNTLALLTKKPINTVYIYRL